MARPPSANQLQNYKDSLQGGSPLLTTGSGCPIADKVNSLTIGPRGPILLQDVVFIDEIAHFDRERIPERVVHAKGAGAFGYFEVTHPTITKYCKAKLFSEVGKKCRVAIRFSTVAGELGSADTVRDPRGFAVKLYTEEGTWDLVGNNTPIFFIRDPLMFPNFIHSQKRNPVTHCRDVDAFWDFITLRQEALHQISFLFTDRGIPDGHRHMNGYGSHTFKLVNDNNEAVYCKFHWKTNQGIKNMPVDKADILAGKDPDYAIRDLYNAIAKGDFPSWTLNIQVMTFEQAEKFRWNPFDLTKVWPQSEFPLMPVGKMTLNENPKNYFMDVEQAAFAPSHMVPGVEPSPDKMLQGRLFSYEDTHRHRLGANFLQIPVNCPFAQPRNYQRDGPQATGDNQGGAPNYYPNSFSGPECNPACKAPRFQVSTPDVDRYNSGDDDNYSQVGIFWEKVLSAEERKRLVQNIAGHLKNAQPFLQEKALEMFGKAHHEYGHGVKAELAKMSKL